MTRLEGEAVRGVPRGGHGQQPPTHEPKLPVGRVALKAPPLLQDHDASGGLLMNAIPMLGSVGAIVMVAGMNDQPGGSPKSLIAAGMFLFAMLGFLWVQVDRQRRQGAIRVAGSRIEYLSYLAGVRQVARRAAAEQRCALTWRHPAPSALPVLAEERTRLFEQAPGDPRFLHVRWGTCLQPLSLDLVEPEINAHGADPAASSALRRLLTVHREQPDLPATLDLAGHGQVEVCGPPEQVRGLARALICSATASHGPEHLIVAVWSAPQHLPKWDWVKWLPHALSGRASDALGPRRLVCASLDELGMLLPADLADRPRVGASETASVPHVLLVVDGCSLPPGHHVVPPDGLKGVTVLALPARWDDLPDPRGLRLSLLGADGDRAAVSVDQQRRPSVVGTGDQCDLATAVAFARRLAPLHGGAHGSRHRDGRSGPGETTGAADFAALLGVGDVRSFDPASAWRIRPPRDLLRVPIGKSDGGEVVHLDLKEAADQGMGPHGLVVGATGSGKSELLRTLVLGLAMTHSPEQLNLVLVDFKGGATFAGMAGLPHVSAVITNLAEELTLVDRMRDALSGEIVRRQELLRQSGNHTSVRDYERARLAGERLDPLPSLLIVVDEFSEMLSAKPEFAELFAAIGRIGRSIGLHLLLASQRLEEGRLRGLESHLSYRIGLRTFSAAESRQVLGVPDAYELPPVPGVGYLRPGPNTLVRFKAPTSPVPCPPAPPDAVNTAAASPASCRSRPPRSVRSVRQHRSRPAGSNPTTTRRPCSTPPSPGWPARGRPRTVCGCPRSTPLTPWMP